MCHVWWMLEQKGSPVSPRTAISLQTFALAFLGRPTDPAAAKGCFEPLWLVSKGHLSKGPPPLPQEQRQAAEKQGESRALEVHGSVQQQLEERCTRPLGRWGGGRLQLQNHMAMDVNKGPFGGHRLGGDSWPLIIFEVVPYQNSWPYKGAIPLCGGSGLGGWFGGGGGGERGGDDTTPALGLLGHQTRLVGDGCV